MIWVPLRSLSVEMTASPRANAAGAAGGAVVAPGVATLTARDVAVLVHAHLRAGPQAGMLRGPRDILDRESP